MNPHTSGQRRAFTSACLNKQLDRDAEVAKAEAIARKPFDDFSFDEMNTAIQRLNGNTTPPNPEEAKAEALRRYEEERRIQFQLEDEARRQDLMNEWTRAFGDDTEEVLAPIIYSLRRPASPEWWKPFNDLFSLPTLEERRSGLFALLGKFLSSFDLSNLEMDLSQRQLVREILSSIGNEVT